MNEVFKDLGIKLDEGKTYNVFGQDVHFAKRVTRRAVNRIANILTGILLEEDEMVGTLREDVLMVRPMMCQLIFDAFSDFDSEKFEGTCFDIEDEFDAIEDSEIFDFVNDALFAVADAYRLLRDEKIRIYEREHNIMTDLHKITRTLDGDETGRDIGVIRSMLTELIQKARYHDEKPDEAGEIKENNVMKFGDLSMYKPRKPNEDK